ncbi:MAG: YqgE/AlgH family protein [Legionellaceae bacterium]|nr:YqgE/AlgH family protein [Legionellaceae bacterium]
MATPMSLANHFLVAMPSLDDIVFSQSVIYVCEHHVQGTVGLIINRPTEYSLSLIFEQLKIKSTNDKIKNRPLLLGGPLQPERGFVIHRPAGRWRSSLSLSDADVTITTSNDIIRAIAAGEGPKDVLVALGYVGWDHIQLEQEIINNAWLVCPYKSELLYEVPFEDRWKSAALLLGVHMDQLISGGGHA